MSSNGLVGVRVGELTLWRQCGSPLVLVQRGKELEYDWERIDDPNHAVFALLEELERERAESYRLLEQCADLGRRVALMELGA